MRRGGTLVEESVPWDYPGDRVLEDLVDSHPELNDLIDEFELEMERVELIGKSFQQNV